MRLGVMTVLLAAGALLSAGAAVVHAQGADKPAEKPAEKPADKPAEKKDEPAKKDEKKAEDKKEAEKEYKDDFKNFKTLMKATGTQEKASKTAVKNKDADTLKTNADKIRYYASQFTTKDKDKRKDNDDYKKWAADLEKLAREWRDLASEKTPDWDKIKTKQEAVKKVCEDCHKKYDPEE